MAGNNAALSSASLQGAGGVITRCPEQFVKDPVSLYLCAEFRGTLDQAVAAWDAYATVAAYTSATEWSEVLNPVGHLPNDHRNNGAGHGYLFQNTRFLFVAAPISLPQGTVQNRMLMFLSTWKAQPQVRLRPLN